MPQPSKNTTLTVLPNDALSISKSTFLGLQHVMAMDIYVVPFLIAMLIGLPSAETSALIQGTFIAAGLATIVQTHFCMKLPMAQGPSYVPLGAIIGIYAASGSGQVGFGTVLGASLVGALLIILLGYTGLFNKIVHTFIPPIVGGTIIFVVGLSLMPVGLNSNIFNAATGSVQQNIYLALISGSTLLVAVILSIILKNNGRIFRIASVILALVIGSIAANMMGLLDVSSVKKAPWFSMPHFAFIDFDFHFNTSAILTMVIIYIVLMAETTGTWFAISHVINEPLTTKQINRGVVGEGFGCMIASLLGSTPVTGYSTNAGVIAITGVASRRVFIAAGVWFIVFGFSSKLAALISAIPSSVIGGVFLIVCGIIAISGLRVMQHEQIAEKEMFVIAIPIIFTLALTFIPGDVLTSLPTTIQYLFGSPIATAALIAIVLNKILPST